MKPKVDHMSPDSRSKSLRIRTNVHAGDWRCTACAGQAVGSTLIKSKCDYCELS